MYLCTHIYKSEYELDNFQFQGFILIAFTRFNITAGQKFFTYYDFENILWHLYSDDGFRRLLKGLKLCLKKLLIPSTYFHRLRSFTFFFETFNRNYSLASRIISFLHAYLYTYPFRLETSFYIKYFSTSIRNTKSVLFKYFQFSIQNLLLH